MTKAAHPSRRATIQAAAALAAMGAAAPAAARIQDVATAPPGRPGEFDFLNGNWRIANRQKTADGTWDEFGGESTCRSILNGVASVEELRIPERNFSGMGLRVLRAEDGMWLDYWMNARNGLLGSEGTPGRFIDGAGVFDSPDTEDGRPVIFRGIWDEIGPDHCRWRQGVSRDGGATWDYSWLMDWTRVS